MNCNQSRVRANIHTLSDEKCGGMKTYGVTLFYVGSRRVGEERFGLFTKDQMIFICVVLYTSVLFGGLCAEQLKGVLQLR